LKCDAELLQAYLDGELEEATRRELLGHLAVCRPCREELSRLKLLWLELAETEEVSLPPEWPYLRQRVMAAARAACQPEDQVGFWAGQKVIWRNMALSTAYLPGQTAVINLARAAGRELPGLLLGLLGRAVRREGGTSR